VTCFVVGTFRQEMRYHGIGVIGQIPSDMMTMDGCSYSVKGVASHGEHCISPVPLQTANRAIVNTHMKESFNHTSRQPHSPWDLQA